MKKEAAIWEQLKAVAPDNLRFQAATLALDRATTKSPRSSTRRSIRSAGVRSRDAPPRLSLTSLGDEECVNLLEMRSRRIRLLRSGEPAQYLAYPGENKSGTTAEKQRALALAQQRMPPPKIRSLLCLLIVELSLDLDRDADFRAVIK